MVKKTKKENNVGTKAFFGTLSIVLFIILVLLLADLLVPFKKFDPHFNPSQHFAIEILLSMTVTILSIYLIYIYLKNYFEIKSNFALGVALAMVALLTFAITSNPLLLGFLGIYGNMGIFSLIPMFFAMISLGILVWLSSK